MNHRKLLMMILVLIGGFSYAQSDIEGSLTFSHLTSLLQYAEEHSMTIKTGDQQLLLARWQKISAQAGVINPRILTNFTLTDNISLPITFLPAEAFGGTPGTFKEVTTGTQYVGNLNIAPQIDLINPVGWARLKSAMINEELTAISNLLVKKSLFESLAATYYNIISLKKQIQNTQTSLVNADTLYAIIEEKYKQGLVRQQDLNDALINKISLTDQITQLELSMAQQVNNLSILCDIPTSTQVIIGEGQQDDPVYRPALSTDNQLTYQVSMLKSYQAEADVKTNHMTQLPVVSFVFYDALQHYSSEHFFDSDAPWLNSQYIGLRLSLSFPDVQGLTQSKMARINQTISVQNASHAKIQNDHDNRQLILDYQKTFSQFLNAKEIYRLKEENYRMALNQYAEDILATDKLLMAFNDLIYSRTAYYSTASTVRYSESLIGINNLVK